MQDGLGLCAKAAEWIAAMAKANEFLLMTRDRLITASGVVKIL